MAKWVHQYGDLVLALTPDDMTRADPFFNEAAKLWEENAKDGGSACIGAGIAVLYLPPRCRKPQVKIVIPSPVMDGGFGSAHIPINYLARHGIASFVEYGRAD